MTDKLVPRNERQANEGKEPSADEQDRAGQMLDRVKSVNEFLADVIDVTAEKGGAIGAVVDAVKEAVPWAADIGAAAAESVGLIRFVAKLWDKKIKITDPGKLGYLACRLAYQQAINQALDELGLDWAMKPRGTAKALRAHTAAAPPSVRMCSSSTAGTRSA